MPSVSPEQEKLMNAAAHNKEFADKVGIPQEVAKEFHDADKAKHAAEREAANVGPHSIETEVK